MLQREHPEGGIEVAYQVWKRRKWLALGVFVFCCATTMSFVISLPNIYRATATVLLAGQSAATVAGQGGSRLDPVTEEVLSRARMQDLINHFGLYADLRHKISEEAVIQRMRQDIRIERKTGDDQSGQGGPFALNVSYQGNDPEIVAKVTNALVSSFVDENNSLQAGQAAATAASLQNQLDSIKQKLDAQQQKINVFRDSHLGELPEQQAANLATLQQLNLQLQQNNANEIQAMNRRETMLKQMTDSGEADLDQLQLELSSLRTRYTDKYPDVVRVEAQIAAMKRQQAEQGGAETRKSASPMQQQFQSVQSELSTYKQTDARLREEIAQYQGRVENVPLRAQQLQTLSQGYTETQEVYSTLLKQYEQAKVAENSASSGESQYRVLDPAVVPHESAGPARARLMLMALLISLAISGAAVFAAEQLNTSFHNVDELRAFTTLPVLTMVPEIVTSGDAWKGRFKSGFITVSLLLAVIMTSEVARFVGHGSGRFVWMLVRHS